MIMTVGSGRCPNAGGRREAEGQGELVRVSKKSYNGSEKGGQGWLRDGDHITAHPSTPDKHKHRLTHITASTFHV